VYSGKYGESGLFSIISSVTPKPPPVDTPTSWPTTDSGTPSPVPTPDWPAMIGMVLEAEAFDRALDMDATNQGKRECIGCANPGAGVDFEDNWEGGLNTGWVSGGEWLEWDVQVSHSRNYNFWIREAHDDTGTMTANVLVNGVVAGSVSVPNTDPYGVAHPPGHWQNWEKISAGSATLNSGINTVRLEHTGSTGSFNLDYVCRTG